MKDNIKTLAYSMLFRYIGLIVYIVSLVNFVFESNIIGLITILISLLCMLLSMMFEMKFMVDVLKVKK